MKIFPTKTGYEANNSSVVFLGELEAKFFKAVKRGNKAESLRFLSDIKFDVLEKDNTTGNNFLHFVCKENTQQFFTKALNLLRVNKEVIEQVLLCKNKEDKVPFDYTKNESFISKIHGLAGITVAASAAVSEAQQANEKSTNETEIFNKADTQSQAPQELVGNEINEDIDLGDFSFGDDFDVNFSQPQIQNTKTQAGGINNIIGLNETKELFMNEIIKPLQDGKNVFGNGFLIHGFSGNGKTYFVEQVAEELNREFVEVSSFISGIEGIRMQSKSANENKLDADENEQDTDKKISEYIDSVIVKINPDDERDIVSIAKIMKTNMKKTNKQGIVFIDEIQNIFPDNNSYYKRYLGAVQAIENSAKNGMVLLATTKELDSIDQSLLNTLRFEHIIENKFPTKSEIKELILKNIPDKLTNEEIEILSKWFNGFSFADISNILEHVANINQQFSLDDIINRIKQYAEKHFIPDVSEEGTTASYDTYLKRTSFSENDPKSLDDVIGMTEIKEKLKKAFGPTKKSKIATDYCRKNKIIKPNGILLYGPPGCGKTFVMKAIAADTKLPLYQVKLSDIGSSFINQTPKNIKKIFDQLRKKYKETGEPSILFFDECDTFFSSKNVNKEDTAVLNTLKEEMNNAGEDGIFIVAATNEKDNLNTAIVRDGRFDTKIEVGYPDAQARKALIVKALSVPVFSTQKYSDEFIDELVVLTNGLSNVSITGIFANLKYDQYSTALEKADTQAAFDKAINDNPIKYPDIKKYIQNKKEEINKMKLKQRQNPMFEWQGETANYDTFKERVYYSENDPKSLDDVVGMDRVKEQFKLKVLAPLNPILREIYKKQKLPLASGIILHGPGGVGKTYIVRAAAAESKIPLYELKLSEMGSEFINKTANNIQSIFNQLKLKYKETNEPSILFLDECDSLLSAVHNDGSGAQHDRMSVMNTLKTELADAPENGIMVIAATNNYHNLDPNVIRSGRFNDHIKIGYPDDAAREAYIKSILSKRSSTSGLNSAEDKIKQFTELTEGMSNADIKTAIENAVIKSQSSIFDKIMKAFNGGKKSSLKYDENQSISFENVKTAIIEMQNELNEERNLNEN